MSDFPWAGREVYVETGQTIENGEKFSNTGVIRTSQQATPADVSTLSQAAANRLGKARDRKALSGLPHRR